MQPNFSSKRAHQLDRHRRAARHAEPQRGAVRVVARRRVQHRVVHRRNALEDRDPVAVDDLQRLVGVEARQHRHGGAPLTALFIVQVCPKEWNSGSAPSRTSSSLISPSLRRRPAVAVQVGVGELGALRLAGGAARCRGSPRCPRRARSTTSRTGSCSASSFSNSPGLTRISSAPALSAPASAASAKSPQANTIFAPGVLEVEAHLAALQQHVHRHHDAAGAQDPVVDRGEVGDVREHQPDAVARLQALRLQQARHPRAALVEHRVAQLDVVQLEGRLVGRRSAVSVRIVARFSLMPLLPRSLRAA